MSLSNMKKEYSTQTQVDPTPGDVAVWDLVIRDMRDRDNIGRERYGTPLQTNNGRDGLVDAYQEVLDLAVYLRQELEERTPIKRLCEIVETFPGVNVCNERNISSVLETVEARLADQENTIKLQRRQIELLQTSGPYDTGFVRGCQFILDALERQTDSKISEAILNALLETPEIRNVLKK